MKISIIVPLNGEKEDANEIHRYIQYYGSYQSVKEIIFINTKGQYLNMPSLEKAPKAKALRFAGASKEACLEAGAFEATGEILFFLEPGTFPKPNFEQMILTCQQSNSKAGILAQFSAGSIWKKILVKIPLCCALCFMNINNFFTSRSLFHLKGGQLSRQYAGTFKQVLKRYAVSFEATLI